MTSTLNGGQAAATEQPSVQKRTSATSTRVSTKTRIPSRPAATPVSVRGRRVASESSRSLSAADLAQRVPFVVVMLLLIGAGVGGTLWLSAQSTQDTYKLKNARATNVQLVERKEALQVQNERARSAEVLAQRASALGMVGVDSAPILVRGADGNIDVVGASEAKLGAPIQPLQPAAVPSASVDPRSEGGARPPTAQVPQERGSDAVSPVPYPPVAPPPGGLALPPAPQPVANEQLAPVAASPAPAVGGGPQLDPATLAPVPGQQR